MRLAAVCVYEQVQVHLFLEPLRVQVIAEHGHGVHGLSVALCLLLCSYLKDMLALQATLVYILIQTTTL